MSLKYGLNITKKPAAPARKSIFDDEDEDEDNGDDSRTTDSATGTEEALQELSTVKVKGNSAVRPNVSAAPSARLKSKISSSRESLSAKQDRSSLRASQVQVKAAEELDASIFDYDSFHDAKSLVSESKKAAAHQDAIQRKPKYINNLLDAAARRKQDQQVAREKLLQREREAEGDEFADKEKFVTDAYKKQQEENRKLEEEEQKKAELEEKRKKMLGGGMQGFYKSMIDQREQQHQEAVEAAAKLESHGTSAIAGDNVPAKSDADLAAELRARGVNIHLNDEGQVTDKRELLSAGLNISSSGRSGSGSGADHLRSSNRQSHPAFAGRGTGNQQAQRERQTRMLEEQLAERTKRAREEEDQERERLEKAAKTTKTDKDVTDAKARYLARKAAKERGEG